MVSCLNPTEAWMDLDSWTANKRHPVVFSYKEVCREAGSSALFDTAGNWINKRFRSLSIRCGKCILCRRSRAQEIAIRACLELKGYDADSLHAFITLTVDDEHMQKVFPGARLHHRPFQLFMKRLRKAGHDCRYLMCGEYGERTHRPHYHIVLFGWCPLDSYFDNQGCYHASAELERLWPFGHVMCASVNAARIFYVAGYTLKDAGEDYQSYVRWSRRPGLGAATIDKFGWRQMVCEDIEWYRHEHVKSWYYRTFVGRKEVRFASRYMDGRLQLHNPEKFDIVSTARQGRILLEQQKLRDSEELAALSQKVLKNRAEQLSYQLARRTRELF